MPRLSIELSERTKALAEARATQGGHASVDEYLEELIRSDADQDFGAPTDLKIEDSSTTRLVQLLDDAEASSESEMSDEDWAALCRRVSAGQGRARPGA
jgi:hypothetical protein